MLLLAFIIVLCYGATLNYMSTTSGTYDDPLNRTLLLIPGANTTFWQTLHFVLYFIIGLYCPNCDMIVIITSILWEVFEWFMGQVTPPIIRTDSNGCTEEVQWWQGHWSDIFYNLSGFYSAKLAGMLRIC